ncbi:MAG TPA: DegT/DnrJ/EryC1/StrS family aminotransferase [Nitrososphaerales archaeon]|nr:DegT/DnrJ/EryC1/StrS family aminotransferase [Nitrososphaerales archaeon]
MTVTQAPQNKIPSVKIAKPYMDDEIVRSVEEILRSGFLVQGKVVKQFESLLAGYLGARYVFAVNSGTAALHSSILAARLELWKENKKGIPEVVTTPLSFAATANAAIHADCKPVFADVNEETFNLDPDLASERIGEDTIAIEPVDVYGLPAELEKFNSLARSRNIVVVEDAAEAIGASFNGRKVGTISNLTCFSTYATKNLHTGEGGFVATDRQSLAEKIEMIRSQGQASRYNQRTIGYNFRMLEMVAAIGIPQIRIIDELNSRRRKNAVELRERLGKLDSLTFQRVDDPMSHAWYMLALRIDERAAKISRDALVTKLRERGIEADVSWPVPIHLQPYFRETFGYKEGDYPVSERICKSVFQLPIQPFLTDGDIERTASAVTDLVSR